MADLDRLIGGSHAGMSTLHKETGTIFAVKFYLYWLPYSYYIESNLNLFLFCMTLNNTFRNNVKTFLSCEKMLELSSGETRAKRVIKRVGSS